MSISQTSLPGEPILIVSIVPPLKSPDDVQASIQASAEFKKAQGGHVYRILDFKSLGQDLPFSALVNGMAQGLKTDGGVNDPDVSTIYVGSTEWVVFGVKALQNQAQYGPTNVLTLCESVDEAIAAARADMKRREGN